ncbi:uncharacterized protein LOC118517624 [Anopheles stephensi]|uniref:uncharacterized protein LOC118517624 n=1 Tax=Anopheles stephensi TaxID=30069 RepID=UPI001658A26D|nr:uncharacterized protein LOC118517624 [Anopheles stephensi]
MNVIKFKLPVSFEPKCKAYRSRRRIPRSAHTTPDTLFSLCELALRKLLGGGVPRRKFWPTVLSLLPGTESRRLGVRHQLECPQDFNIHLRSSVNYANHWSLLTESLRHEPRWPRIRIGDPARNRITRLHQDYPSQHIWQIRPYDMLTSAFIVRTAAKIASLEQQRSQGRFRSGRTLSSLTATTITTATTSSSGRRLSRERSIDVPDSDQDDQQRVQQLQRQQLMVIGKRTTGSYELRLNSSASVKTSRRKRPTR